MSNSKTSKTSTSQTNSESIERLTVAEVRSEYERADLFCGEVQSFSAKAGIPAINELRNAGKHLFEALGDEGQIVDQSQLQAAFGHSRRAAYEAYEAGILTALAIIAKFKTDYEAIVISQAVPDWREILLKAHRCQKAVEDGRQRAFDREGDHTSRMEAFRELRDLCESLELSRDEANKLVEAKQLDDRRHARSLSLRILGILLAVVSIIFGVPAFMDWLSAKHLGSNVEAQATTEEPAPNSTETKEIPKEHTATNE
jgi:hypothetical protein